MTDSKISMPFEADTAIPKTRDQIIAEGAITLRQQHKEKVEAHRAAFSARAESEWLRNEQRRKEAFIQKYTEDNYIRPRYPYADLSPAAQYRMSLPYDERLDKLAAVQEFGELLYCLMARNTTDNRASIDQIKQWCKPYISEVDGDYKIVSERGSHDRTQAVIDPPSANYVVHATHLSRELAEILTDTWLIDVEFGRVVWRERNMDPSLY